MEIKITRPQGTEDVTPKQIYKWHTVERIARETAESFGFHETRIPTFENTNLFLRSVGETTDVVQKEMYTVTAKETQFTLRPEGTSGTIRSMLQNGLPCPRRCSISCPASATNVRKRDGCGNSTSSVWKWQAVRDRLLMRRSFLWQKPFSTVPAYRILPSTSTLSAALSAVRSITRL